MAVFVFAATWLQGLLSAHHVSLSSEFNVFFLRALSAVIPAVNSWWLYLAFEPYVRRRWPQSMITWSRVLTGGFRDPLVGGHLLIGVALGIGIALLRSGTQLVGQHYGSFADRPLLLTLAARGLASDMLAELIAAFLFGAIFTLIFMLLRAFLRRQWLAAAALVALRASAHIGDAHPWIELGFEVSIFTLLIVTLLRWGGLLPTIVCFAVGYTLGDVPIAFSTWYAGTILFVLSAILALTAYAFHTAVAGRPLLKAGFLEPN